MLAMLAALSTPALWPRETRASDAVLPREADVRSLLMHRIDDERQSLGMIVGFVSTAGRSVVAQGARSRTDSRAPAADSLFNIGSITKLFTAVLLADAVRRGELRMDDPVQRHLPAGYSMPTFEGRQITLTDLVTHTSGLPSAPDDFPPETDLAAQASYGRKQFADFLARLRLTEPPGTRWNYSNFSYALLGEALAFRTQTEFKALMTKRVLVPLGLSNTYVSLDKAPRDRVIAFHDFERREIPQEPTPVLPGFGGMYSCANDLLTFVSDFMGIRQTSFAKPMAAMMRTKRPIGAYPGDQALGPQIYGDADHVQIGHAGSTSGHSSALLWDRARFGVVVLSNASPPVMDIAFHMLDPRIPLATPVRTITLDSASLARFVGRYVADEGLVILVTQDASGLIIEVPGNSPKMQIVPETDSIFSIPRLGMRFEFEGAAPAPAQSVHIDYVGKRYTGRRVPE